MRLTLSAAQMRLSDEYTINTLGVPSLTLMERAGRAVAERALALLKEADTKSVLVVCGGGNNGGDGFAAARILAENGISVTVLALSEKLSPDAQKMREQYRGKVVFSYSKEDFALIIDCIFGTGLSRDVGGVYAEVIDKINESGGRVLSADIPSGISGDSGLKMGAAVEADETVTIGEYKNGLILSDGRDYSGKITAADIGITVVGNKNTFMVEGADVKALFPKRKSNSNKGTFGRAAIIGGSLAYSGAPFISALAALNTGAGYTYLCLPHSVYTHYIGRAPELILCDMGGEGELVPDGHKMEPLLSVNSIAIGMGCGVSKTVYSAVKYLLQNYAGTLIIDADGLNSLAEYGIEALNGARCKVILTPHIKEFSRLTGKSVSDILSSPTEEVRAFSKKYGAVVVLKNNSTVITDGDNCYITASAPPSLAKGGSGDALSGIICALAAMGTSPVKSAYGGSYLLGAAATAAQRGISEYSVKATDVIASIGRAIYEL